MRIRAIVRCMWDYKWKPDGGPSAGTNPLFTRPVNTCHGCNTCCVHLLCNNVYFKCVQLSINLHAPGPRCVDPCSTTRHLKRAPDACCVAKAKIRSAPLKIGVAALRTHKLPVNKVTFHLVQANLRNCSGYTRASDRLGDGDRMARRGRNKVTEG